MANRIILSILLLSLVKLNGTLRVRRQEPAALQSQVPDTGQGTSQPSGAAMDALVAVNPEEEITSNLAAGDLLPIPIPDSLPFYNGSDMLVDGCPRDEVMVTGVCHEVLTRGPCPVEEIVLLDPGTHQGFCAPRLCPPDRIFVFSDQLCHDPRNSGLCSGGRELFQTAFGTPICQCPDGTYETSAMGGCELLLAPSPDCAPGQVHWFHNFASPQECQVDPCGGLNLQRSVSDLPFLPSNVDGVCHQLGQGGGACQNNTYYSMSLDTLGGVCSRLEEAGYLVLDNQTMTNFETQYGPFIPKEVIFGISNNLLDGVVMQQQSGGTGIVTLPNESVGMSVNVVDMSTITPSDTTTTTTMREDTAKGFSGMLSMGGSKTANTRPQESHISSPQPRPHRIVVDGIPLGKPALDTERLTQLVRQQQATRRPHNTFSSDDSNISFISSREVGEYDFSISREERREGLASTRHQQQFGRRFPFRNVIPGKLRLKATVRGGEAQHLDTLRLQQTLAAAHRSHSTRDPGFYRSIMTLLAHHLKPTTHHNRVPRYRQQRGRRSNRVKRTVQSYFVPDNVFDNRLLSCRSGAKRDINLKCRSRILPAHSPFQAFDSSLNNVIDDRLGKSNTRVGSGKGTAAGEPDTNTTETQRRILQMDAPMFRTRGGGGGGGPNKVVTISTSPLSPKALCPQGANINMKRGCDVI
ncbi:hypothetical protein Pcinc_023112 [Petrolisthes cinctipes]|uniref:DUF4789 domain-containing protein n=1 Tax=Petrolisthes cinctipes TaxID=88211 RepID=A0AAE1FCX2_PETCI|nr:hypothetical protein Pcinc_023112 [Petrolisthes cinctipes]